MRYGSLQCTLKSGGDGCGISGIRDLGDAKNPQKMLLVDIQCLIVFITGKLFELQFTNHSWENCLEFPQRNGT
jgi:hypothetical protein